MFSSHFLKRLTSNEEGYKFSGVRRWTDRAKTDIKSFDLILVPINLNGTHWVLSALDLRSRKSIYHDSKRGNDTQQTSEVLERWVRDEVVKNLFGSEGPKLPDHPWVRVVNPDYVPPQTDNR